MSADLVLSQFDLFSEAPNAIPRLRQFIVELAMRGRLTERDHQDEPASQLLGRLIKHKEKLVKEGLLKHHKHVSADLEDHISFDTPSGWIVTTLGDVAHKITDGTHKTPNYVSKGVPFVSVKDFSGGRLDFSNTRFITRAEHEALYKRCDPKRGDILIGRIGTLGKAVLVDTDEEFSLFVSVGLIRFSHKFIAPDFLRLFLNSPIAESEYDRIKVGGGTHTNKLNLGDLHTLFFPLPPLAEQHRIVDKVKQLTLLCDGLEAEEGKRERQRAQFTSATLSSLTNGAEPDSFQEHAMFCIDHVPDITSRPEQILSLRRAIFNLAVRGRLVLQDLGDEPSSELLKRIQADKLGRVKAGTLRKEHPLPAIAHGEEPFGIPRNWMWARIGTCALLTEYGTSVRSDELENGVPVLAMGHIQDGNILLNVRKKVPRQIDDLPQLLLKRFDLLYNRTNSAELVGKTGIYLGDDDAFTFASYLIRIRFNPDLVNPVYINLAMNAPYFRETQIVPELRQQCGQANVNGSKLRNMMIPLPPLAEQHRIVARVEELMTVCKRLEGKLSAIQEEKGSLLESVLYHALADAPVPAASTTLASAHFHIGLKPVPAGTRAD